MASVVTEKVIVGESREGTDVPVQPPREYPKVQLKVGDEVILHGKVVSVDDSGVVVLQTKSTDLPGTDGYSQRIVLHGLQLKKVQK